MLCLIVNDAFAAGDAAAAATKIGQLRLPGGFNLPCFGSLRDPEQGIFRGVAALMVKRQSWMTE